MSRHFLGSLGFALVASGLSVSAFAASITAEQQAIDGNAVTLIFVEGELQEGDEARFANTAINANEAVVFLSSPGGNLLAGIEIGKAIRLKGFATVVPENFSCASACALAWLGGLPRFMAAGSTVGFHAAFDHAGTSISPNPAANAVVGAYLNQLGLQTEAIIYITETHPSDIRWLTFDDAEEIGLEVRRFRLAAGPDAESMPPAPPQPARPEAAPARNFAAEGEWIQMFSRAALEQATSLAAEYQKRFDNVLVARYDNGWHVVVIGPYAPGTARPFRDRLVARGEIPKDSFVNRGERFVEIAWRGSPPRIDWTAPGAWIQMFSRALPEQATTLAGEYRRTFRNTLVFSYDNGWYVVVIGPYEPGIVRPLRDRLVARGDIPSDSFVNRGDRFVALVWGELPPADAAHAGDAGTPADAERQRLAAEEAAGKAAEEAARKAAEEEAARIAAETERFEVTSDEEIEPATEHTKPSVTDEWRLVAKPFDASRLDRMPATRARAISSAARDPGFADVRPMVESPTTGNSIRDLQGRWRCRTIKLGGLLDYIAYGFFDCEILGYSIRKITGSQRFSGRLYEGSEGLVFLGISEVMDEVSIPYGSNPARDMIGFVRTLGPDHLVLELPSPRYESLHDIIEFVRDTSKPSKRGPHQRQTKHP